MPKQTKAQAKDRLQRSLHEIPKIRQLSSRSSAQEFVRWHSNVEAAITYMFGQSSQNFEKFKRIRYTFPISGGLNDDAWNQQAYLGGLDRVAGILESMIDGIEEYWDEDEETQVSSNTLHMSKSTNTTQVFIIHGRDHGTRDTVARFIENLGLEERVP